VNVRYYPALWSVPVRYGSMVQCVEAARFSRRGAGILYLWLIEFDCYLFLAETAQKLVARKGWKATRGTVCDFTVERPELLLTRHHRDRGSEECSFSYRGKGIFANSSVAALCLLRNRHSAWVGNMTSVSDPSSHSSCRCIHIRYQRS
jgi:hypothetical protein